MWNAAESPETSAGLAACAAASHWALGGAAKPSECVAQPGAREASLREGGRATAFWHRQGGTFITVLWRVTATAAPSLGSLTMVNLRWRPAP